MITTAIILGLDGSFPLWYKQNGLAKNEEVAKWVFNFCGWETDKAYPELAICVEEIDGSDVVLSCDTTCLFVLGCPLQMN